jgi:stage III sporulation protein AE
VSNSGEGWIVMYSCSFNKRLIVFCLFFVIGFYFFSAVNTYAEESPNLITEKSSDEKENTLKERMNEDNKATEIYSKEVNGFLEQYGIKLENFTFEEIINVIENKIKIAGREYLGLALILLGISTASCLVNRKEYKIVCALAASSVLAKYIYNSIILLEDTIMSGTNFMTAFIPIYTTVNISSGNITAAASANTLMLSCIDGLSLLLANFILPFLTITLCVGIFNSLSDIVNITGLLKWFSQVTTWGLTFLLVLFTGVLSVQNIIGSAADNAMLKTGKFLVQNGIPVIGKTLGDGYGVIQSGVMLLRSTMGGAGIAGITLMVLPVFMELAVLRLCIGIGQIGAEALNSGTLKNLFSGLGSVMNIAIAVLVAFTLFTVIYVSVLLKS